MYGYFQSKRLVVLSTNVIEIYYVITHNCHHVSFHFKSSFYILGCAFYFLRFFIMDISLETYKVLKFNNLLTCLYLPAVVYLLNYSGQLYNLGKERTYVEYILIAAEFWKFFRFYRSQKNLKRKFTLGNIFKSILTCGAIVLIFHVGAILFGAPFLTEQYETLFFAVLLTVLTALPVCLYLESDYVFTLFSSIMLYDEMNQINPLEEYFLWNIRSCLFGSWLGAVLIPLDWNRPYQEWPIPCCYGAMAGCFVGNAYSFMQYAAYGQNEKRRSKCRA